MATTTNSVIVEKINNWINEGDKKLVKLFAASKMIVMMNDGKYRSYAFTGGEEFFFSGVREGKRDEFIFEFSPVDSRTWKHAEVTDKVACKTFSDLETMIAKGLGFSETTSYGRVKGALRRRVEKELAEANFNDHLAHYGEKSMWGTF